MFTLATRTRWVLVIVACVAAGLAFAAPMLGGKTSTATAEDPASPAELFHLSALAAPPSDQPVPFLEREGLQESGHDIASARLLATDSAGSQVIAIPRLGSSSEPVYQQLCSVVTEADQPTAGAGACASTAEFNEGGVFVTLSRGNPDTDEVVGILPDGVASVVVHSSGKATRTLDVRDSVVRFKHDGATSVTIAGPKGSVERPIARGLDE